MQRMVSLLKNARGQSITELALVLPFVLLLIGGVIDFGLIFLVSNVTENAAREGARKGATQQTTPTAGSDTFPSCMTNSSLILSTACKAIPNVGLFNGFTVANTAVTGAAPNQTLTVTITGTYSWYLVPGMLAILHNSFPTSAITLTRKATMRWEWQSPT